MVTEKLFWKNMDLKEFDATVVSAEGNEVGKMPRAGDIVLTRVRFADNEGSKIRPALILFEEHGNVFP